MRSGPMPTALPRVTPYRDYLAWIAAQDRAGGARGLAGGAGGAGGGRRVWRRTIAGRAPVVPEQITLALSETLTAALTRAGAPAGADAQHRDPGGLGDPARPADRARRRGVRGDGGGPAAGDCRHREHGGAVHQHAAAAGRSCRRASRCCELLRRGAGAPVAADGAPASRAGRDPGAGRAGRAVRHAGGVRELSGRPRRPCGEAGGLRLADVRGHDATHYPLSLLAQPGERLQLRLDYRPDLFDRRAWRRWRGGWSGCWRARLPSRIVRSAGSTFSSPAERHTILREWNDTARAVPGTTLPELFAAQAARTPDAVAVVFEDERLSYGELDARSNQLAHHLRGLGVGPEVVVGLCVERSLEMLVGLLGILKAGGAYLPLDPDYPPERLAFMLADAGAPVLLTRAALRAHLPAHDVSSDDARTTRASCASMPTGPPSRSSPRPPRPPASSRSTPPTSSTPPAPPERPRASPSRMAASPILRLSQIDRFAHRHRMPASCSSHRSASTPRASEICGALLSRRCCLSCHRRAQRRSRSRTAHSRAAVSRMRPLPPVAAAPTCR